MKNLFSFIAGYEDCYPDYLPWWLKMHPYVVLYMILKKIFEPSPSVDTRNIIILGLKGCGKTTMWRRLRGEKPQKGTETPTSQNQIESFTVSGSNGRTVRISSTRDIGGGDDFVKQYDSLIENGTMVYFLVDLCTLEENIRVINARVKKILIVAKEKNLEKIGLQIVATHLDEAGYTEDEAKNRVMSALKLEGAYRNVIALDLFDDYGFKRLRDEIVNAGINI